MTQKRKKASKKLTEEQKQERQKKRKIAEFKKKIRSSFIDSGFTYFPTNYKTFRIGNRDVELDYLFIYENIIIICEDNTKQKKDKDHIRSKNESFGEIRSNVGTLTNWLIETFPDKKDIVAKYRTDRFFLFYIYISQNETGLTEDDMNRYSNLRFWEPETLSYFCKISQSIHYSAKYELFRYLGLTDDQIGFSSSEGEKTVIRV